MAFSLLGPAFPFGPLLERQFALLIAASRELETLLANPAVSAPAAGRVRDLERLSLDVAKKAGAELMPADLAAYEARSREERARRSQLA